MAWGTQRAVFTGSAEQQAVFDEGLRQHMLRVYNYMASGLAITGIVAYIVMTNEAVLEAVYGVRWMIFFAAIGMAFFFGMRIHKMSFAAAQMTFWVFAVVMGLWMGPIVAEYTGASIARVFFITAGMFAGMSLYGYTTKRDLTGWGSFLFMGMIGIFIGFLVNGFLIQSSAMHFAMAGIGVIVFTGLTAYDTQRIKNDYAEHFDGETLGKLAIMGALHLYLDFINLFIMLLQFFGNRN